ncbi:MAG: aldehyde dehydrogenase [Eggerthellaceae bacterium]|nr:aldehyde dehydrogenase [Eggerthellaceae bacterium]
MNEPDIQALVADQRAFFATGATVSVEARLRALAALERAIVAAEPDINAALKADLGKSSCESYMCEVGLTLAELRYQMRHVRRWTRPHRVGTGLANFPARSFTVAEPYGVVLVMSPWNYPFMLTMEPLVGAIAAGNCCTLKPSAYSPATSSAIARIVAEVFDGASLDARWVRTVEGGRAENTALLDQRFDYIFFTGGTTVGRLVMEKASANLTPVTLELGGKSPCIVTASANLKVAAARIVFGKYLNCGQTCVAPDYVLVEESVHDEFIELVKQQITAMFGEAPLDNPDYGHMVNEKHFKRVMGLIDPKKVVAGGTSRAESLSIEPTVLDNVAESDAVMQEEIFGPVMPVIKVRDAAAAEAFVKRRPKPLALYLFTTDHALEQRFLTHVSFGGGCINDTIVHLATSEMGFGGVGNSGIGSYHGRESFDTFSHKKSILKKATWLDMPMRYQPYTAAGEKLIRLFLR